MPTPILDPGKLVAVAFLHDFALTAVACPDIRVITACVQRAIVEDLLSSTQARPLQLAILNRYLQRNLHLAATVRTHPDVAARLLHKIAWLNTEVSVGTACHRAPVSRIDALRLHRCAIRTPANGQR
jgi:hypothetical protein